MTNYKKITLRKLNLTKDISEKYLTWMNDFEIQKYILNKKILNTLKPK